MRIHRGLQGGWQMRGILKRIRGIMRNKTKKTLHQRYPQYDIGFGSYGDLTIRSWGEDATVKIGAFCSFAHCQIYLGGEHRTDWVTTYPFSEFWESVKHIKGHPKTKGDVIIGNDVWIGNEAIVMSGVNIGDGAVIGTRALVTKDVPAFSIVAGIPARVVRMRFDEKTISRLVALQWWNWDKAKIERYLPLMLREGIAVFLDMAEREKISG